jgi:hypothetical protein
MRVPLLLKFLGKMNSVHWNYMSKLVNLSERKCSHAPFVCTNVRFNVFGVNNVIIGKLKNFGIIATINNTKVGTTYGVD